MARVLIIFVASCAVAPTTLPSSHPASARAPVGRLVGAPATLRAGVVAYDLPPSRSDEPAHHHHHVP